MLSGMNYGTVQVIPKSTLRDDGTGPSLISVSTSENVRKIIQSIIPTYGSTLLTFEANPANVRLLRMVMHEYPMIILGTHVWNKLLTAMRKFKNMEQYSSNLVPVTPSPVRFKGTLLPFQKLGLDFLLKTNGTTLVADEMGLGKTIQTLAFLAQRPDSFPALVIAPLVTLENWKREIMRFLRLGDDGTRLPEVKIIRTGKESRLPTADFYLINYELIHKRIDNILASGPKTIIFDEIQSLRHTNTYKIHACNRLAVHESVTHRIGLSGTPIYNKGTEIFGLAEIILPGIFGSRKQFNEMFYDEIVDYGYAEKVFNPGKLADFLQRSIMIRRKKLDVLSDLPDKSRLQQEVSINMTMYKNKIQEMYSKIAQAKKDLDANKKPHEKKQKVARLNKLILEMRVEERQAAGMSKAPFIVEYIVNMLEDYEDEKFVVFCHHKSVHKILYDGLWKFSPVQIIGGQTDKARQQSIDTFQTDPKCHVIICGLRAGNVGINLTKAAYVIFAELDWSPAVHRQAEDRLHRIGQKNTVFAHYLVGSGTFDEYIVNMLVSKSSEINAVLGDAHGDTNNKKALELLESKFAKGDDLISKSLPDENDNDPVTTI